MKGGCINPIIKIKENIQTNVNMDPENQHWPLYWADKQVQETPSLDKINLGVWK